MATSNELKELGNKAFADKDYETSIKHFTAAIELDPQNHVLYSNRSASYASLFKYEEALSDAEKTIEIKPDWVKGYGRKGAALQGLKRIPDALKAFSDGLKLDGTNKQCLDGVEAMKSELFANSDPGFAKISHVFRDPKAWETIASNPRTAAFASDPEFKAKITMLQQNPQLLQSMLSDFRVMQALGVLLNINQGNDSEGDVKGSDLKMEVSDDDEEKPAEAPKKEEPKKEEPKKEEPKQEADAGAAEEAADEGTPASKVAPEIKKKALAEKELGTAAYKKKDFPTALKHYNAARELDPTDIVFYLNISAVYIETKDYDNCIKECEKALEVGSENRADYELIAKAQARMAKAYADSNRLEEAIKWYGKAISNKRSPDYVKAKNDLEKTLKEKKRLAYINPELSAKHKDQGNELFKAGKFAEALEQYTEAIQRNPSDGKLYSNRAATYAKLARFDLSLQDCEECLKLEPTFVKGHLRKGNALVFMKKFSEAMSAFEEAKKLDPANAEADQGIRTCYENMYTGNREERAKQAMNDPEIQSILGDPVMQMILQQMSSDPTAVREHLKNPEISRKISKLAQAGILEMR